MIILLMKQIEEIAKNKNHLGTNCFVLTAVEENCKARQMRTGLCVKQMRMQWGREGVKKE